MTRAFLAELAEPSAHLWEARLLGSGSCMVTTVRAEASEGEFPPFPISLILPHPTHLFYFIFYFMPTSCFCDLPSPVQCSGRICIASLIGVLATRILAGIIIPLVG